MPKLLRDKELISFVQTRAPAMVWRRIKRVALDLASDGTATRLCTDGMVEFLQLRPWLKGLAWLRPQDLSNQGGRTGFGQVNLPLSNFDEVGAEITSRAYLTKRGLINLFDEDKLALRDVLARADGERKFSELVYIAAKQLGVSGAAFAYTFLVWLADKYQIDIAMEATEKPASSRYAVRARDV